MYAQDSAETHGNITDPADIRRLLKALQESRTTRLKLEGSEGVSWPVRLLAVEPGKALHLDIGIVFEIRAMIDSGTPFRLIGEAGGAMLRTAPLTLAEQQMPGYRRVVSGYPDSIDIAYRRKDSRASVAHGMRIDIRLETPSRDAAVTGRLENLSVGGCLLSVPLQTAEALYEERETSRLTVYFPNGEQLKARGRIRHIRSDDTWSRSLVGYEFSENSQNFHQQAAYCVREIERQRAYETSAAESARTPSPLFDATSGRAHGQAQRGSAGHVSHDLVSIGDWLQAQLLQVRGGGPIAEQSLLRHARILIDLLQSNREAVLYATGRLGNEPSLVHHGLAVAVRLADLLDWQGTGTQQLEAIVACALIHDFGKVLLPATVRHAPQAYDAEQRATMATHVAKLTDRLVERAYIAPEVITAVIEQANERLDGSGYPRALRARNLPGPARAMAVVDVADAMRRDRADRKAWPQSAVHKHLLGAASGLDHDWARLYIRRFGQTPIGSLAKYSSGLLVWIQRLGRDGKPAQARVAMNLLTGEQPTDETVDGRGIVSLGRLETLVEPHEYGLDRLRRAERSQWGDEF
jgi:c-di-GMP-binding flagellar brake protein YcgR